MPWAGNIAKTMMSNRKQFTATAKCWPLLHVIRACSWKWPDVVTGISAHFSKFAFTLFCLFCYITNHLTTGPLGNSEFWFPQISMFPSTSSPETVRLSGNKIHCSPQDQSLSVKYYQLSHRNIWTPIYWPILGPNSTQLTFLFIQCWSCDDTPESIFFQIWTFSCLHAVFLMNTTKVQT